VLLTCLSFLLPVQGRHGGFEVQHQAAKKLESVAHQLKLAPENAAHSVQQTFENVQHNYKLLGEYIQVGAVTLHRAV
jgi:hypothetical protein